MADIVKDNSNRVYQNPAKLLILVPIGAIVFIYLFDIVFLKWNEYRLDKVTSQVIVDTLDHETFRDEVNLKEYVEGKFKEYGYDEGFKHNVEVNDKYIFVTTTYTFSKDAHASTVMIGYFDEYKKPVTIKYYNDQDIPDSNYYIMDQPEVNIQ